MDGAVRRPTALARRRTRSIDHSKASRSSSPPILRVLYARLLAADAAVCSAANRADMSPVC
jgi:hypothetical protein